LEGDADLALYFNSKDGFKSLVDSLEFNYEALPVMQPLLENDKKLAEEF